MPHEGTVTTPDQCFPIGFCHPLCFPKASPRLHPTHNLQRLAGSGENSDRKPRKDMTPQSQVGPVQSHQCCAHVTGLALSSRPRNKSFRPLQSSSLTSLMLRLHSKSAGSPGAEAGQECVVTGGGPPWGTHRLHWVIQAENKPRVAWVLSISPTWPSTQLCAGSDDGPPSHKASPQVLVGPKCIM